MMLVVYLGLAFLMISYDGVYHPRIGSLGFIDILEIFKSSTVSTGLDRAASRDKNYKSNIYLMCLLFQRIRYSPNPSRVGIRYLILYFEFHSHFWAKRNVKLCRLSQSQKLLKEEEEEEERQVRPCRFFCDRSNRSDSCFPAWNNIRRIVDPS